jgi:hypothetical protein
MASSPKSYHLLSSALIWTSPLDRTYRELDCSTDHPYLNPTLAVNSSGDPIAGWQSTSGQILVAERKAGVWGAPISIAPAAFRQGFPARRPE